MIPPEAANVQTNRQTEKQTDTVAKTRKNKSRMLESDLGQAWTMLKPRRTSRIDPTVTHIETEVTLGAFKPCDSVPIRNQCDAASPSSRLESNSRSSEESIVSKRGISDTKTTASIGK